MGLGGGEEVAIQSNFVVAHSNIVMGLVETGVGLVPAGGGCKEVLWRWMQTDEAKADPDFAPLKVFNIIGYGTTATSTVEAEPLKFLRPEDKKVMNRNSLFEVSKKLATPISSNISNGPLLQLNPSLIASSISLNSSVIPGTNDEA